LITTLLKINEHCVLLFPNRNEPSMDISNGRSVQYQV
jgi:hypothetical protein